MISASTSLAFSINLRSGINKIPIESPTPYNTTDPFNKRIDKVISSILRDNTVSFTAEYDTLLILPNLSCLSAFNIFTCFIGIVNLNMCIRSKPKLSYICPFLYIKCANIIIYLSLQYNVQSDRKHP